jgi:hypothetical protein
MSHSTSFASLFSRAETASPQTPEFLSKDPSPFTFDSQSCSSPKVFFSNPEMVGRELAKTKFRKVSSQLDPLEERIAKRFHEIFTKYKEPDSPLVLLSDGWLTQTIQVVNLKGDIKSKTFLISKVPLAQSSQVITKPSIRLSKDGSIKTYVHSTQKNTSETSSVAFEASSLELFAKASQARIAPKIYLCPNDPEAQTKKALSEKYRNCFVTRYIEDGDLVDFLLKTPISMEEKLDIAKKITQQLINLHALKIYHRDIKLENILYERESREIKICDFGLATDHEISSEKPCTVDYIPPEYNQNFFLGKINNFKNIAPQTVQTVFDTAKQDHYTLGVTLFNLLTLFPYTECISFLFKKNKTQLMQSLALCKSLEDFIDWKQKLSDQLIDTRLEAYPIHVKAAVRGLIQFRPDNRISLIEALGLLSQ